MSAPIEILWQIDPFGSSDLTPLLFNPISEVEEFRYKYAVLNRIGDSKKRELSSNASLDFYL